MGNKVILIFNNDFIFFKIICSTHSYEFFPQDFIRARNLTFLIGILYWMLPFLQSQYKELRCFNVKFLFFIMRPHYKNILVLTRECARIRPRLRCSRGCWSIKKTCSPLFFFVTLKSKIFSNLQVVKQYFELIPPMI